MTNHASPLLLAAALAVALPAVAAAQSVEEVNRSNNPLTPAMAANLQDQYVASYQGEFEDSNSNQLLLRGVLPHRLLGPGQLLRLTVPLVVTSPDALGSDNGLGDINVFDVFLFRRKGIEIGVGPMVTIPTATEDTLGTGTWQAGVAGMGIARQRWGLVGGLVTYQHSFAKEDGRGDQNNLQLQPYVAYNMPYAFYLRSSAIWNFDFAADTYFIPVGVGAGKVFRMDGGTTLNVFAEPQLTLLDDGDAPQWQFYAGLNVQFPLAEQRVAPPGQISKASKPPARKPE